MADKPLEQPAGAAEPDKKPEAQPEATGAADNVSAPDAAPGAQETPSAETPSPEVAVPETASAASETSATIAADDTNGEPALAGTCRPIERIMDINLELTVKIGSLKMKFRDILDLHPGSILELDKSADSPLSLEIGNKTIAQGQVVTVGEYLGLKVAKK